MVIFHCYVSSPEGKHVLHFFAAFSIAPNATKLTGDFKPQARLGDFEHWGWGLPVINGFINHNKTPINIHSLELYYIYDKP